VRTPPEVDSAAVTRVTAAESTSGGVRTKLANALACATEETPKASRRSTVTMACVVPRSASDVYDDVEPEQARASNPEAATEARTTMGRTSQQ